MSAEIWQGIFIDVSTWDVYSLWGLKFCPYVYFILNNSSVTYFSNDLDASLYVKFGFGYTVVASPAEWVKSLHITWVLAYSNSTRRSADLDD